LDESIGNDVKEKPHTTNEHKSCKGEEKMRSDEKGD
jgi:hypothetical protein